MVAGCLTVVLVPAAAATGAGAFPAAVVWYSTFAPAFVRATDWPPPAVPAVPAAAAAGALARAAMSRVLASRVLTVGALCVATATPTSATPEPARLRVVRRPTDRGRRAWEAARALAAVRAAVWASVRSASRTLRREVAFTEGASSTSSKKALSTGVSSSKEERCLFIVGTPHCPRSPLVKMGKEGIPHS